MKGVVVAPQPLAVAAGVEIFRAGGNAFDAAIATVFVQGLVDPTNTGLGGGMACTAMKAGQAPEYISAMPRVPASFPPDLWVERVISRNPEGGGYLIEGFENQVGHKAVCVPGHVAGLWEVHQSYGTLEWARLLEPAIRLSEGFRLPAETRIAWQVGEAARPGYVTVAEKLGWTAAGRAIYLKEDGTPYRAGEVIVCEDYGNTLRRIASGGADEFYRGSIAEEIDADFRANGGFVSGEDLENYRVVTAEPVKGRYRGLDVFSSQPPQSGVQLIELLHILGHFDLASMDPHSPEYVDLVARAMQACFVDRGRYLGDPEFVDVPVQYLISEEHTGAIAERLRQGDRITLDDPVLLKRNDDSPDTTHVSVWDSNGNAVSITSSLGSSSGAITPGLGFIYNNYMHIFNPFPGHPNSIQPGKRRTSGAIPTILSDEGRPVLITGAPGGVRQSSALWFTITGVLDHGLSPAEALAEPRWHSEDATLHMEAGIYATMGEELRRMGWEDIKGRNAALDPMFFARSQTIHVLGGENYKAASDPRGGGSVGHFRG